MEVLLDTTGKKEVAVHYMNAPVPYVVEENFGGCFFGHDDSDLAEVLQDQEIVYQLFQGDSQCGSWRASSDPRCNHGSGQTSGRTSSSRVLNESHLAVDEALARELQEIENQLADALICDNNRTEGRSPIISSTSSSSSNSAIRPPQVVREDDIDPDNMTYEELQQLGEAIGTESKGLSENLISLLPSSTYKTGIFSRKEKHDECVICYMAYKNRDKLITLPCEHQYHKTCVTKWLKINKACPVCGKEVFGS